VITNNFHQTLKSALNGHSSKKAVKSMLVIKNFPFFSFHMEATKTELVAMRECLVKKKLVLAVESVDALIKTLERDHNKIYCNLLEKGIEEAEIINILKNYHVMCHIERLNLFVDIITNEICEAELLQRISKIAYKGHLEILKLTA